MNSQIWLVHNILQDKIGHLERCGQFLFLLVPKYLVESLREFLLNRRIYILANLYYNMQKKGYLNSWFLEHAIFQHH